MTTSVAQPTPSPLGCYKIDKGNPVFLHSAGDYDPDALTIYACLSACTALKSNYASLEGRSCLCSQNKYVDADLEPDDTNCASPCTEIIRKFVAPPITASSTRYQLFLQQFSSPTMRLLSPT
ncbi:uncharacterized protein [Amphiura filiformis]|uniref:uncharacterized protein n=1 Tax=Amphiura filiformis TaxID=82378 RepID=UPI003B210EF3